MSVPYALYAKTSGSDVAVYAYIYNLSSQVVPIEADVAFSNNGIIQGEIYHAPGSSAITLGIGGNYEITFSVSSVEPNQFSLYQNGVAVAGSTYGSGAGTQQNSGTVIITASAGDVVSLTNHTSAAAVTLHTLAGGVQTSVNASIKIRLLSK